MARSRQTAADSEVGRRLRLLRIERGVSQTHLGDQLGLTFQQIQKYEKGTNRISAGRLKLLSEIFEVPITYFFGPQKSMTPEGQKVFEFLNTADALRLLRAFSKIKGRARRAALLQLAESMSDAQ